MAGKKKESLQYLSESEALKRARACAEDAAAKLEAVNGRHFSKRERKQFLKVFMETVILVLAKHFAKVPDTDDRVRKNPR